VPFPVGTTTGIYHCSATALASDIEATGNEARPILVGLITLTAAQNATTDYVVHAAK